MTLLRATPSPPADRARDLVSLSQEAESGYWLSNQTAARVAPKSPTPHFQAVPYRTLDEI
jgi:hypothetical protein